MANEITIIRNIVYKDNLALDLYSGTNLMRELLIFTQGVGFMAIRLRMKIWLPDWLRKAIWLLFPITV